MLETIKLVGAITGLLTTAFVIWDRCRSSRGKKSLAALSGPSHSPKIDADDLRGAVKKSFAALIEALCRARHRERRRI